MQPQIHPFADLVVKCWKRQPSGFVGALSLETFKARWDAKAVFDFQICNKPCIADEIVSCIKIFSFT